MSQRTTLLLFLALAAVCALAPPSVCPQQSQNEELNRRAKSKVQPVYPDLARKMNISGSVKVEVVVGPNGVVKEAKVVGGHPVLANAALDAAKRWRFEPAARDSTGVIDFKFEPR